MPPAGPECAGGVVAVPRAEWLGETTTETACTGPGLDEFGLAEPLVVCCAVPAAAWAPNPVTSHAVQPAVAIAANEPAATSALTRRLTRCLPNGCLPTR